MGFFSGIFGSGARTKLVKTLATERILALNVTDAELDAQLGMAAKVERMSASDAMALPEAIIVAIIDTYADSIRSGLLHAEALREVERLRIAKGSTLSHFQNMTLDEYVRYRLALEVPDGLHPGMDKYWFNLCMQSCCAEERIPWSGGPTRPPSISRPR